MRVITTTALVMSVLVQSPVQAADDSKSVVAVFNLNRIVKETPTSDDLALLFGGSQTVALKDLVARINKAGADENVKGVVLQAAGLGLGWAQLDEVRRALKTVRDAGKPILVHTDSLTTGNYALLSSATRLSMVPTGMVMIMGMNGEQPYLRGLLDMLGVRPDFLTCGEYKSAGEMFMLKEPSAESDRQTNQMFDSLWNTSTSLIADGRNVDVTTVKKWIDRGLYTAETAKEVGIIDVVEHHHGFVQHLKEQFGDDVKLDKKYGQPKGPEIDFSTPFGVLQFYSTLLQGPPKPKKSNKPSVAIVYVEGAIMHGGAGGGLPGGGFAFSTPIRKALDAAAADDTIKAVVLRVDSPGGSAVGSEIMLEATKRLKAKKPFIVSMGNVAGSGGYYIACGADTIFAERGTITGSIGVVSGKFATTGLWNKVGVSWKSYSRGKNAGLLGSATVFSDEERELMQSWMDEVYEVFKGHVVAIRGDRLKKDIDALAGGRVYTGEVALELGLVDRIGGLYDAIAFAADEAKLEDYELRVVPRPKNPIEQMLEGLQARSDGNSSDSPVTATTGKTLVDLALPHLRGLDPARSRMVIDALQRMELFRYDNVQLMTPVLRFGE